MMQQILKTEGAYKDHQGNIRDIGCWDSPSANEHDGMGGGNKSTTANRWLKSVKLADDKSDATTDGQRIQITALCALQLMVYCRQTPGFTTQPQIVQLPSAPATNSAPTSPPKESVAALVSEFVKEAAANNFVVAAEWKTRITALPESERSTFIDRVRAVIGSGNYSKITFKLRAAH